MPILLKNQTSDQLHASPSQVGVSPQLARRFLEPAVKRGELPVLGPDLTAGLRRELLALTEIPHLTPMGQVVSSQDGFTKYLFQGRETGKFDAVCIPLLRRCLGSKRTNNFLIAIESRSDRQAKIQNRHFGDKPKPSGARRRHERFLREV